MSCHEVDDETSIQPILPGNTIFRGDPITELKKLT